MRDIFLKPGTKTREIIRLWEENKTKTEIAKIVGCTKANVIQTVRRHFGWDNRVDKLSEAHHKWLVAQASKAHTPPSVMARALLVDAIEDAMAREVRR